MGATRDCLAELEYLSAAFPGDRRDEILRRVTDLFLITADRQRPADTAVFNDVMSRLASEVGFAGRAELAQRLAGAARAPADLIRSLARQEIGIARPLLERSPVLTDADLIELARSGHPVRIAAMAKRPAMSAALTDALARICDDAALTQMAANPNASFSLATLGRMAARARNNPDLRRALLHRADLPPVILEGMQPREAMPKPAAGERGEAEGGIEWIEEPGGASDDDEMDFAAPIGGQAEARLAELALAGRLEEAIEALSALTGLAPPLVRNCLITAETPALVVLCKAHRFASPTFSALLQLRHSAGAISTKAIASAMRRYETMDPNMAQRIMRFLKVRLANTGGES